MRVSCPSTRPLAAAFAVALVASATVTYAQFVCDVDPWSQTANSGFGAGPGEIRGFAVTPQSVPAECLVDNNSVFTGVVVNATQQGGASTMPIERIDILDSGFNGPPGSIVISSGPGGTVQNVPTFPAFVESRLPTNPVGWDWDLDDDGSIDNWVAPTVYLDGDATPGQFLPFSTNGGVVPCNTGLDGSPINEPCSDGDPNFRSMGIGVETAAGFSPINGLGTAPPLFLRTTNPDAAPDNEIDFLWDFGDGLGTLPSAIETIRLFDDGDTMICERQNVAPGQVRSCLLTPAQIQQFLEGKLEVEFDENDNIVRFEIVPANQFIFADGFESGDTSSWSNTVP